MMKKKNNKIKIDKGSIILPQIDNIEVFQNIPVKSVWQKKIFFKR